MGVLRLLLLGFALVTVGPARAAGQPPPSDVPAPAGEEPEPADSAGDDSDEAGPDDNSLLSKATLTIKVKSEAGKVIEDAKVFVDARSLGDIEDGELTLTNIPEGQHAIAIEARGYLRFERTMTVRNGERATLDAVLAQQPPPRYSPVWWGLLGVSAVMSGGGFGYWWYGAERMDRNFVATLTTPADLPDGSGTYSFVIPLELADCGKSNETIQREKHTRIVNYDRFERACRWHRRRDVAYVVGAVGSIGVFVSVLMLVRHRVVHGALPVGARPGIVIVPAVTPDSTGAALMLTW